MIKSLRTHSSLVSPPQPADSANCDIKPSADANQPILRTMRKLVSTPLATAEGNRTEQTAGCRRGTLGSCSERQGGEPREGGCEGVRGKGAAARRRGRGRARRQKEARQCGCRDGWREARGDSRGDGCGRRPTKRLTEGRAANVRSVRRCRSRPRSTQVLGQQIRMAVEHQAEHNNRVIDL